MAALKPPTDDVRNVRVHVMPLAVTPPPMGSSFATASPAASSPAPEVADAQLPPDASPLGAAAPPPSGEARLKTCGICQETMPISEYAPKGANSHYSYCRVCNKVRTKYKQWSVRELAARMAAGTLSKADALEAPAAALCPHGSVHGAHGRRCHLCGALRVTAKFPALERSAARSVCCAECDSALRVAAAHPLAAVRAAAEASRLHVFASSDASAAAAAVAAAAAAGAATAVCDLCGSQQVQVDVAERVVQGALQRVCGTCSLLAASCHRTLEDTKRALLLGGAYVEHQGGAPSPAGLSLEARASVLRSWLAVALPVHSRRTSLTVRPRAAGAAAARRAARRLCIRAARCPHAGVHGGAGKGILCEARRRRGGGARE